MDDLDLRLVHAFVVVAEHRHFGRAAEALHIAQPALSRQIRRLEDQVGARLFDRDTRGTRLTAAGEAFLPAAREALSASRSAVAAARAADGPDRLVVGHVSALLVTAGVRALREARPEVEVRTLHLEWHEPRAALLGHRVDVVLARLPFPTDGLEVVRVRDESRVLLVPREHRLAGRDAVRLADFAEEPLARLADPDPAFAAFWRVEPRPDGGPAPAGPVVGTPEDRLEVVAGGEAVALATGAVLDGALRPDLVAIPVEDVEPVSVVLATRAGDRRALVTEFVRIAAACLGPG
ncbi:LysR family transcriptional regulator [Actinomycetospora endophytica]|uniref:LysR family transcriptional regulator n=1 Tax=Actinomycetospora endophytica TaxID=2291215 RepID=A0ABS8PE26_9PSEU|nr:LysR family transcriptional regulator [Actinomycetospora endophytica]MCD2196521.1 LysR family transcriptional regulator [Actinomycetospora endophytica]